MEIIDDKTVVVFSSDELKNVLEGDNGYNYIYFGADITLSSGIAINKNKTDVTIDGTYNSVTYEYIDQKKLGYSDTIYVTSALTKSVTFKNVKATGYNYYGIIYVPEQSIYKDISITYDNITYFGPQISFNPMGLTRFIDCNITIGDNYASGNEVAECNRIEIGGTTTIIHNSTANSAFWFRNSNNSLTILASSLVHFTSTSRELIYGINDLTLDVLVGASFYVSAYNGLAYGTYGTSNTTIYENALFSLTKTSNSSSYALWYSYGSIYVNSGGTLSVINNNSSSNYNIYFRGSNTSFVLNNPLKVVLYNRGSYVINASSSVKFNFTYDRINLFNKIIDINSTISKDNLPDYSWYKDQEKSIVSGSFSGSSTIIDSNNYTSSELEVLPAMSYFNFINKKILSIGSVTLHVNALSDTDTAISGVSGGNASVLIEYNQEVVSVNCLEDGTFSYSYGEPMEIGTSFKLTAKEYDDVIYSTKSIVIVYSGEIIIDTATKCILFEPIAIGSNPILCPRKDDLVISVIDSRINSSNWKLYAAIDKDMSSDSGIVLDNSLVYVDGDGNIFTLSSVPTLVYTGEDNGGEIKTTSVSFDYDKGILFRVTKPLVNNLLYKTNIIWTLEE